eukprot:6207387-Pleurochrysis_carterae.AAC.5
MPGSVAQTGTVIAFLAAPVARSEARASLMVNTSVFGSVLRLISHWPLLRSEHARGLGDGRPEAERACSDGHHRESGASLIIAQRLGGAGRRLESITYLKNQTPCADSAASRVPTTDV